MELNYGVTTTNKFDVFLNEDEDPLDILRLEESSLKKKTEKKKNSPNDKVKSKTSDDAKKPTDVAGQKRDEKPLKSTKEKGKENDPAPRRERKEDVPNRPRPQSGANRDVPREGGNRPERTGEQGERRPYTDRPNRGGFRPQRFERPEGTGEKLEEGEGSKEFGRGRGGRGRGGRGTVFRGGRREYDRHSGSDRSGVKPQDKRDGAGAHNWGTISDDIQDQLTTEPQPEGTDSQQPTAEGAKVEEQPESAAPEPVEEEEKVLTLDEWKAQQEGSRIKAEFNIRKPGEGCAADPQWKKMVVLKKKEEEVEEEEEEYEEEVHHGRQTKTLPIEIKFATEARRGFGGRGRGRGGRGGAPPAVDREEVKGAAPNGERAPRGRGGQDGGGGRKPVQKAPNVADELDFPSLDKAITQ